MNNIAVFCGSSKGFNKIYAEEAKKVGDYFAKNNIGLVFGGGKVGLMGILADTIMAQNGRVTGVIPSLLKQKEVAHTQITEMVVTKKMSSRKIKMSQLADGYMILAGGFGTMDELFEVLTLGQLGIEKKPIGILNTNNFYDHTIKQLEVMVNEGFLKPQSKNMILISESIEDLIEQMKNYSPDDIKNVIDKVVN